MDDILPRLWLNRTPNFILAQHSFGRFDEENVQVLDVREDVRQWQARNTQSLRRFLGVLRQLVDAVRGLESGRAAVYRLGCGALEVRSLVDEKWSALPPNLKAKWAGDLQVVEDDDKPENTEEQDNEEDDDSFLDF